MRILHVLAPAPFGGLERVVQDLSRAQAEAGHQVMTAPVGQSEEDVRPFLQPLTESRVETTSLLFPPRSYLAERQGVRALCSTWRAEILHTHGYRPDVVDGGVGRRLGIGTTTTVHGFTGGGFKNRFYEWLQCRAYQRFGAVVAVSRALRETLLAHGVPDDRLHVVRNALARPDFLPRSQAREQLEVPPSTFHIGWIGRLSPEKGPDVLLDSLSEMDSLNGVQVSIIGDGPLRIGLAEAASRQGLDASVRFLGPIPDAPQLLTGFDLIVLSSRTEGTPMVLLEAMAAGVPVVATRVGGIPDMVSPADAYLVPSEDPEALAGALTTARTDEDGARARASSAEGRFHREYGLGAWVEAYDRVYGAALKRAGI